LGGVLAVAAIAAVMVTPPPAEAVPTNCRGCFELWCLSTDEWGTDGGCKYIRICPENEPCDTYCVGQDELCNLPAVAMSGQVVVSADAEGLTFDDESGLYRRSCDGTIVVIPGGDPAETAESSLAATIML
jgi:hypothetical protein